MVQELNGDEDKTCFFNADTDYYSFQKINMYHDHAPPELRLWNVIPRK